MSIYIRNDLADPNNKLLIQVKDDTYGDVGGLYTVPVRAKNSFTSIYLVFNTATGQSEIKFYPLFSTPFDFPKNKLIGCWGTVVDGPELQRAVQTNNLVLFRGDMDFWGTDLYDFTTGSDWRERSAHAYGMAPYGLTAALLFRLECGRKNSDGIAQVNVMGVEPPNNTFPGYANGSMQMRAQGKGYSRKGQKDVGQDNQILPVGDDCRFWANANADSYGHVMGSGFILKGV